MLEQLFNRISIHFKNSVVQQPDASTLLSHPTHIESMSFSESGIQKLFELSAELYVSSYT